MNIAMNYDAIRIQIKAAFQPPPAVGRCHVPDNVAIGGASKPVPVTEKDKDGNEYQVGEVERTYAVPTRPKGNSSMPLHDDAFEHTRTVRAVNTLPDNHKALVKYCYTTHSQDWETITYVAEYVWAKMQLFIEGWERFKGTELKPEKIQKIKSMVFNAMQQFQHQVEFRKRIWTTDQLANMLGVNSANWRRDWGPFWNQLLHILIALDDQAIKLVYRYTATPVAA